MTEKLLAEISVLKEKLAKVEKERDAAIATILRSCDNCKHDNKCSSNCIKCGNLYSGWEWRGVRNEAD